MIKDVNVLFWEFWPACSLMDSELVNKGVPALNFIQQLIYPSHTRKPIGWLNLCHSINHLLSQYACADRFLRNGTPREL